MDTEQLVLIMTTFASVAGLLFLGLALTVLSRDEAKAKRLAAAELARLKQASLTDYLTGLGNRRAYQDDLVRNVAECWSDGSVMTIALVDVDGLKQVNDRSGYITGDRLLTTLAGVLRTADVQSIPYRLGGDEFALAFPGMPATVARQRMEQVRGAVEGQLGGTTVSIGLAWTSLAEPDLLDWFASRPTRRWTRRSCAAATRSWRSTTSATTTRRSCPSASPRSGA